MRHEKHGDCPNALEEDAPKVSGHGPMSMWTVGATKAVDTMVRGCSKNGGN